MWGESMVVVMLWEGHRILRSKVVALHLMMLPSVPMNREEHLG